MCRTENRPQPKTCPFQSIAASAQQPLPGSESIRRTDCLRDRCALWVGSTKEGNCALVVMALRVAHPHPSPRRP